MPVTNRHLSDRAAPPNDLLASTLCSRAIKTFGEAAFREKVLFEGSKLLVEKIAAQVQQGQRTVRDQLG